MRKEDQIVETEQDVTDALIELGAASELTLTIGNFRKEANLEPLVFVG
jgi:hypothetical protein